MKLIGEHFSENPDKNNKPLYPLPDEKKCSELAPIQYQKLLLFSVPQTEF